MIAHKKKLGAVCIALAASSPAWAHMDKMAKCGDIASNFEFIASQRNQGVPPKQTYKEMKNGDTPKRFSQLFNSKKKEREYFKRVINKIYFDKKIQRFSAYQISHAVRNKCMGWGHAKWHRLKTH